MAPTPKELRELVEAKYVETLRNYDGYLVIGRDLKIYRWSRYVAEIFGLSEKEMLSIDEAGERQYSIRNFLPKFMDGPEHDSKMAGAFQVLDDTLVSGEDYGTKKMGAKGGVVKQVDARTIKGEDIKIWVELCPLYYEPTKEMFFMAAVRAAADSPKTEIKESEEAKEVFKDARLKLVDQVTDLGGRKFTGGFHFIKNNVFSGYDEKVSGPLSLLLMVALCGCIIFTVFALYSIWNRKPPTIQHIEVPVSPSADR